MSRRVDERAVTVQIGAVLLLAILVSALALYQVTAVPDQNHETEFSHNERVTNELVELRDAIRNAGSERLERGVPVTLGAQYQTRTVAINPPAPTGRIATGDPRPVAIENASVSDSTVQSILDDPPETRVLTYEPRYNEYRGPTTVLEHTLLYDEFDGANVTLEEQTMIDDDSVTLVFLDGDLSRSATGTVSVSVETIGGPTGETDLQSNESGNVTITLPTESPDRWEAAIGTTFADSPRENARVRPDDDRGTVTIELADETYDLRLAQVSVGDGGDHDERFEAASSDDDSSSGAGSGGDVPFEIDWIDDSVTVPETETRTLEVNVVDADGVPIEDAMVYFSRRGQGEGEESGRVEFVGDAHGRTNETGTASVDVYGAGEGETAVYASVAGTSARLSVTVVADDSADDGPPSGTDPGSASVSDVVANQNDQTQTITVHVGDGLNAGEQVTIDLSDPHQTTGNSMQLDYSTETATVRSGSGSIVDYTTNPNTATVVYESNGDDAGTVISIELAGVNVGDVANEGFAVPITGADLDRSATFVVKTEGDVTVPQDTTVTENVYATGTVDLAYRAAVDGTVRGDAGVVVGNSAEIGGDVFSDGSVELDYRSRVGGEIVAGDEVTFQGNEVEVDGSVTAVGDVTTSYRSVIRGDVETGGRVILDQEAEITGDVFVNSGSDIQCGYEARIDDRPCSSYVDDNY